MDINLHQTFLIHNNHEESLKFYRDILGFELRNDVGYNGMHWLTMGSPNQQDVSIVLYPLEADPGITEDEQRTIKEMMAKGTFGHIILASKDMDAAFAEISAKGAEVVQEPTDQPYGVRDCVFRDPAGNLVRINQID